VPARWAGNTRRFVCSEGAFNKGGRDAAQTAGAMQPVLLLSRPKICTPRYNVSPAHSAGNRSSQTGGIRDYQPNRSQPAFRYSNAPRQLRRLHEAGAAVDICMSSLAGNVIGASRCGAARHQALNF